MQPTAGKLLWPSVLSLRYVTSEFWLSCGCVLILAADALLQYPSGVAGCCH